MKIQNVLWHVNGALFDTYPALMYSFSRALNEMGYSVALNVIDGLVRRSLDDCVGILSSRFSLDPDRLWQKFVRSYRRISPTGQTPFPGARDICEFIQHHGGSNLAYTETGLPSARGLFEVHRFSGLIDDTFVLKISGAGQTYPSLICAALDKYSLNPAETLLIGSRSLDIRSGQLAGVRTCLFGKAEETITADIHVEKYSQLLSMLEDNVGDVERRHTDG